MNAGRKKASLNLNLVLEVPGRLFHGTEKPCEVFKQQSISSGVQGHKSETTNPKHFAITGKTVLCPIMLGNSSSRGESC